MATPKERSSIHDWFQRAKLKLKEQPHNYCHSLIYNIEANDAVLPGQDQEPLFDLLDNEPICCQCRFDILGPCVIINIRHAL